MKDKKLGYILLYALFSNISYSTLMGVHIDSFLFYSFSKKILSGELNPLASPFIWNGKIWPDMLSYSHPPLLYYYMALVEKIFSDSILALHISFVLFFLILSASIYFLLKKYVRGYFVYSLLFVSLPIISFSSHTLMMDIPSFSFFLAGVVLIDYGLDENSWLKILSGSFLGGMSILISLNSIFFIPLVFILIVIRKKWKLRYFMWAILPAFLLFMFWICSVYAYSGRFVFRDIYLLLSQMKSHSENLILSKMFYFFISVGFLSLFSPFFFIFSKRIYAKLFFTLFLITFIPSQFFLSEYGFYGRALLLFIFFATIFMFFVLLFEKGDGDMKFFKAWILLFLFYEILISPHGAARYYLIVIPPILLIFVRLKEDGKLKIGRRMEIFFFSTILLVSILVSTGDIMFSKGYEKISKEILKKYSSQKIWYAAHWDLGYYIEKGGGKQILRYDRRVSPGDILIKTEVASTYETGYEREPYGKEIGQMDVYPPFPIYVMNSKLKCGLYSDYWGFYPFKLYFGKLPLERVYIYEIEERLPPDEKKEKMNYGFFIKNGKMDLHFY